jgi:hypothetical protein
LLTEGTAAANRVPGFTPTLQVRTQRSHDDGAQQDQVNRPAATDVRQVEGPYRRVRLNAWLGHIAIGINVNGCAHSV